MGPDREAGRRTLTGLTTVEDGWAPHRDSLDLKKKRAVFHQRRRWFLLLVSRLKWKVSVDDDDDDDDLVLCLYLFASSNT